MKNMKHTSKYLLASLTLFAASCRDLPESKLAEKTPADMASEKQRVLGQEKWHELAKYLGLHDNHIKLSQEELAEIDKTHSSDQARKDTKNALLLSKYGEIFKQPSDLLMDKSQQDKYKDIVFQTAHRFADKAYATRCADIRDFRISNKVKPMSNVDVYELRYTLQGNFEGESDGIVRTGLVSVPKNNTGKFTFLGFGHKGDYGLSVPDMVKTLGSLIDTNIVIAPSFPDEPVCAGELSPKNDEKYGARHLECAVPAEMIAGPVGHSLPFDNDVDELLGMYHCVSAVAAGQFKGNEKMEGLPNVLAVSNTFIGQDNGAASALAKRIEDKVKFLGYRGFPLGSLVGASRGGMVAALALAKSGAGWYKLQAAASEKSKQADKGYFLSYLYSFYMNSVGMVLDTASIVPSSAEELFMAEIDKELFQFIAATMGPKYGLLPPASFNGLATLGAPVSVMFGRMRLQLEHLVKGNLGFTKSANVAGIRQLGHLFDDYRAGNQSVENAAQEIVARDVLFLAPYIMAALKKWNETSPIVASISKKLKSQESKGLRSAGSFLMVHHEFDRVVPFEQFLGAANIMAPMLNDGFVRKMTAAPAGLNLVFRTLVSPSKTENARFHLDDAFFASLSLLPSKLFYDQILQMALNKTKFFGFGKETSDDSEINANILAGMAKSLQVLAKKLFPEDQDLADAKFEQKDLQDLFTNLDSENKTEAQEKMLAVMSYYLGHGEVGNLQYEPANKVFTSQQTSEQVLASWIKTVY